MDHSPFRQTFELEIFISAAEKSILNLVKLCLQNMLCLQKFGCKTF